MSNCNIIDIDTLRTIKSLEAKIVEMTTLQAIKENYLFKLQKYTKYSNINRECNELKEDIKKRSISISDRLAILQRLRKEVDG